jgi:lipid II isoglutaminyl synthase (glutamine-hydrolysing)
MSAKKLTIVHLYPVEMSIYGDRGNVLTLVNRLKWRGIEAEVKAVGIGDRFDLTKADIIFAGGGQDRGQIAVGQDLQKRSQQLHKAAEAGVVMLTICGSYQLFGRGFTPQDGAIIPGIGIFKAETFGSSKRMIGNIIVETPYGRLVGFENHSGQTILDADQAPLGSVDKGWGNNSVDRHEGAVHQNVFGSYLHGPILPKNPTFADELLLTAVQRKGISHVLKPLDDELEQHARLSAMNRPR